MMDFSKETGRYLPIDHSGKKYNMLTVIDISHKHHQSGSYYWNCICDCGAKTVVSSTRLGQTKSCGCASLNPGINKKHGFKYTSIYGIWHSMKDRCLNKNCPKFKDYGGRGIFVCKEWIEDFMVFYNDMNDGYIKGLHLDRINNEDGYYKGNCRWASIIVSANNKRTSVYLTFNNETHTLAGWGRILGIKDNTISSRYRKGYSVEECLYGKKKDNTSHNS